MHRPPGYARARFSLSSRNVEEEASSWVRNRDTAPRVPHVTGEIRCILLGRTRRHVVDFERIEHVIAQSEIKTEREKKRENAEMSYIIKTLALSH